MKGRQRFCKDLKFVLQYQIFITTGWNEYNRTLGRLVLCANKDCQPSHLTSLRLTKNTYVKYPGTIEKETFHWSAIQINFTIPKPSEDNDYCTFNFLFFSDCLLFSL